MEFLPVGHGSTRVIFDESEFQKYKLYQTEILHFVHSLVKKSQTSVLFCFFLFFLNDLRWNYFRNVFCHWIFQILDYFLCKNCNTPEKCHPSENSDPVNPHFWKFGRRFTLWDISMPFLFTKNQCHIKFGVTKLKGFIKLCLLVMIQVACSKQPHIGYI